MIRKLIIGALFLWFVAALMLPPMSTPRSYTQMVTRQNRLRQLTIAVLSYEESHGAFPRSTYENEGLLSWRVQLLPYLGEDDLFNQIDKSVAWDHPNNKRFHDRMPEVFEDPDLASNFLTSFRVIAGHGTGWTSNGRPIRFDDFTDGVSNSIAIISMPGRATNWLAPTTLTVENAPSDIDFGVKRYSYSFFDGSIWDGEPQTEFTRNPFLISDAG